MSQPGRSARRFAPGKLILYGEHAVVYGHPAVAAAVERGTTVQVQAVDGPSRLLASDVADPRLEAALATILPPRGVGVAIHSDLPTGRGMGSSAALAVALVRALAAFEGREADLEECVARGFELERVFHGTPSGLDHTVSAWGGAVRYRRGPDGPEFTPVEIAPLPLVVLDTGVAGDTSQLVAGVRARRPAVDPLLEAIGALVLRMLPPLARGDLAALGAGMRENQALLRGLGVSSPEIEALVSLAEAEGAVGAKLAGAGGGGVVIALHPQPERLLAAAAARGVVAFPTRALSRPGPA